MKPGCCKLLSRWAASLACSAMAAGVQAGTLAETQFNNLVQMAGQSETQQKLNDLSGGSTVSSSSIFKPNSITAGLTSSSSGGSTTSGATTNNPSTSSGASSGASQPGSTAGSSPAADKNTAPNQSGGGSSSNLAPGINQNRTPRTVGSLLDESQMPAANRQPVRSLQEPFVAGPPQNVLMMGPDFAGAPIEGPDEEMPMYPANKKKNIRTLKTEAFKNLLDQQSPLTPEQIIEYKRQKDRLEKANATPGATPPRPVSSTLQMDISPGHTPPVFRLSYGYVSTINFVDSTGQPWPVSDYSLGNSKDFNIQWDKKTHTLFMQSMAPYATGNMAIRLANLETPLTISLVTGQKEVDYRIDLQVRGRGPNAKAPVLKNDLPVTTNTLLINVLDGIPPPDTTELQLLGGPGRAWLVKGRLLLRTPLTVLAPAWSATVSSPDGTRVYELPQTPLILASDAGKTIKLQVKGI